MPHFKPPSYIIASPWNHPSKINARSITIIDTYRDVFGKVIPEDKQYWTMCGSHFDEDSNPVYGELDQMLESDLINKNQFYGVDREASIIKTNKKNFPRVNWIRDDFLRAMEQAVTDGIFNPAIINYDGVMQPKFGTDYLRKIFKLLDRAYEGEVFVVSNFVLKNPYSGDKRLIYTIQKTLNILLTTHIFPDHWDIAPYAYVYGGYSPNSNAQMGILGFFKKKHVIGDESFTPRREITA